MGASAGFSELPGVSRRCLMQGLGALLMGQGLFPAAVSAATNIAGYAKGQILLSGRKTEDGGYRVTAFSEQGDLLLDLDLPDRGHGLAATAVRRQAVMFARRPGTYALVFSLTDGQPLKTIEAAAGRHFFGHGVFSPDGKLLYATENDYDGEQGVVGIYAADLGYRRVGEWELGAIGPHELRLGPDGTTLVIAVGGILTHPDLPRMKLNIPDMAPSLVFLDRRDGHILQRQKLPEELHLLSIRHLDVNAGGAVAVGLQYQGPKSDLLPLVAVSKQGQALQLLPAAKDVLRGMKNYCGSVAFDGTGQRFAVSSPRGNRVTFWSIEDGRFLSSLSLADGCGLAAAPQEDGFLLSSGAAGIKAATVPDKGFSAAFVSGLLDTVTLAQGAAWDNHMLSINLP